MAKTEGLLDIYDKDKDYKISLYEFMHFWPRVQELWVYSSVMFSCDRSRPTCPETTKSFLCGSQSTFYFIGYGVSIITVQLIAWNPDSQTSGGCSLKPHEGLCFGIQPLGPRDNSSHITYMYV